MTFYLAGTDVLDNDYGDFANGDYSYSSFSRDISRITSSILLETTKDKF
jgi:hypothetical protein